MQGDDGDISAGGDGDDGVVTPPLPAAAIRHKVHAQLLQFLIPIDDLTPDPKNARKHGERSIAEVAISLDKYGQDIPLIVQREGMIVRVGNGRLASAKRLGWTHIAAIVRDESQITMTGRAIADNRTAELSEWDDTMLAMAVREMRELGEVAIGFSAEEIESLMQPAEVPERNAPEEFKILDENLPVEHQCPKCKYVWSGKTDVEK